MEKSKLALYLGNFDLKNGYASVARIFNIAALLDKNGFSTFAPCFNVNKQLFENLFGYGMSLSLIDRPAASKKDLYLDYAYYLNIISEMSPDVVLLYDFPSKPMRYVLKYCKKNDIPVISDCTEWYDSKCVRGFFPKLGKIVDVFLRMRILNKKQMGLYALAVTLKIIIAKRIL